MSIKKWPFAERGRVTPETQSPVKSCRFSRTFMTAPHVDSCHTDSRHGMSPLISQMITTSLTPSTPTGKCQLREALLLEPPRPLKTVSSLVMNGLRPNGSSFFAASTSHISPDTFFVQPMSAMAMPAPRASCTRPTHMSDRSS